MRKKYTKKEEIKCIDIIKQYKKMINVTKCYERKYMVP